MGMQQRRQKQMRMDEATEVRGRDLNVQSIWLYCYNAPGKLVYVWVSYVTRRAVQYVLLLSKLDTISLRNTLFLSLAL